MPEHGSGSPPLRRFRFRHWKGNDSQILAPLWSKYNVGRSYWVQDALEAWAKGLASQLESPVLTLLPVARRLVGSFLLLPWLRGCTDTWGLTILVYQFLLQARGPFARGRRLDGNTVMRSPGLMGRAQDMMDDIEAVITIFLVEPNWSLGTVRNGP